MFIIGDEIFFVILTHIKSKGMEWQNNNFNKLISVATNSADYFNRFKLVVTNLNGYFNQSFFTVLPTDRRHFGRQVRAANSRRQLVCNLLRNTITSTSTQFIQKIKVNTFSLVERATVSVSTTRCFAKIVDKIISTIYNFNTVGLPTTIVIPAAITNCTIDFPFADSWVIAKHPSSGSCSTITMTCTSCSNFYSSLTYKPVP